MKTLRLFCIVFFVMSTLTHATEDQNLSQQARESVRIQTQEMSALGVPEATAQKMLSLMHQNQFQHQNIVRAKQLVMDTALDDLPTKPVIDKAMEGMAKQVAETQVIKAMEAVQNRQTQAHRLARMLTDDRKSKDVLAGTIADCLAAGMDVKDLDTVVGQLQVRTREQTRNQAKEFSFRTMQTVRTMSRMGGATSDVSDAVCKALGNQYTSHQMEQLRHQFVQQSQSTSGKQLAHQYAADSLGKSGNINGFGGRDNSGSDGSGGSGHRRRDRRGGFRGHGREVG